MFLERNHLYLKKKKYLDKIDQKQDKNPYKVDRKYNCNIQLVYYYCLVSY